MNEHRSKRYPLLTQHNHQFFPLSVHLHVRVSQILWAKRAVETAPSGENIHLRQLKSVAYSSAIALVVNISLNEGAYSLVACLSHLTICHAPLPRRSRMGRYRKHQYSHTTVGEPEFQWNRIEHTSRLLKLETLLLWRRILHSDFTSLRGQAIRSIRMRPARSTNILDVLLSSEKKSTAPALFLLSADQCLLRNKTRRKNRKSERKHAAILQNKRE